MLIIISTEKYCNVKSAAIVMKIACGNRYMPLSEVPNAFLAHYFS